MKKLAYVAPVIVSFDLLADARAGSTRGTPPDPPLGARVTREGKIIDRR